MAYKVFAANLKEHLLSVVSFLKGESSVRSFKELAPATTEVNAIQNATSASQVVELSNAYYDQLAHIRTMEEIYKTPKQYYQEYVTLLENNIKALDVSAKTVEEQHSDISENIESSKILKSLSSDLQFKLSLIDKK